MVTSPEVCGLNSCWEITGSIAPDDFVKLSKEVENCCKNKSYSAPIVFLNTGGGDLETAIAIGRQLRKVHASTLLDGFFGEGKCYSSCVFVLAGAVKRSGFNNIVEVTH